MLETSFKGRVNQVWSTGIWQRCPGSPAPLHFHGVDSPESLPRVAALFAVDVARGTKDSDSSSRSRAFDINPGTLHSPEYFNARWEGFKHMTLRDWPSNFAVGRKAQVIDETHGPRSKLPANFLKVGWPTGEIDYQVKCTTGWVAPASPLSASRPDEILQILISRQIFRQCAIARGEAE
jgi:hypothetical protein